MNCDVQLCAKAWTFKAGRIKALPVTLALALVLALVIALALGMGVISVQAA